MLPEDLHARVRLLAAERGVSMATLLREALKESVGRVRPTPRSLGVGASSTDTARRTAAEHPAVRCRAHVQHALPHLLVGVRAPAASALE